MKDRNIQEWIILDCFGFTAAAVLCSVLAFIPRFNIQVNHIFFFELFICSTLICAMNYLTSKIPVESQMAANAIMMLNNIIIIIGVGSGLFGWFHLKAKNIILVSTIILVIFAITNWMMILQYREMARMINGKIAAKGK